MAKPPAHVSAAQLRAALYRKLSDLESKDRDALARQIVLEKAGNSPVERLAARPEIEVARNLLNGSGDLLSQPGTAPGVELWEILLLRRGIKLALDTLRDEELRVGAVGLAEWLQAGGEDRWRANRRGLADALLTVQRLVAEGTAIRNEARAAAGGQGVSLPSDRGDRPVLSPQGIAVLEAIQREVIR